MVKKRITTSVKTLISGALLGGIWGDKVMKNSVLKVEGLLGVTLTSKEVVLVKIEELLGDQSLLSSDSEKDFSDEDSSFTTKSPGKAKKRKLQSHSAKLETKPQTTTLLSVRKLETPIQTLSTPVQLIENRSSHEADKSLNPDMIEGEDFIIKTEEQDDDGMDDDDDDGMNYGGNDDDDDVDDDNADDNYPMQTLDTKTKSLKKPSVPTRKSQRKCKPRSGEFCQYFDTDQDDANEDSTQLQLAEIEVGQFYHCSYCKKKFKDLKKLQNHEKWHQTIKTPQSLQCFECNISFSSKSDLDDHTLLKHDNSVYDCHVCGVTLEKKIAYINHMREHNGRNGRGKRRSNESVQCEQCGKHLSTSSSLKSHLLICGVTEKKFQCSYCPKKFISVKYVQDHVGYAHTYKRHKLCPVCGKICIGPSKLKKHLNTAHPESSFTDLPTVDFSTSFNQAEQGLTLPHEISSVKGE